MRPSISRLTCLAFVVAISVGCAAVPDGGVEPDESVESVSAALSLTPPLPIRGIKNVPASLIRLSVVPLAPLYLQEIRLTKGASDTVTTGTYTLGTPAAPGIASVTISGPLFDSILADAKLSKLTIELVYNSITREVRGVYIEPI